MMIQIEPSWDETPPQSEKFWVNKNATIDWAKKQLWMMFSIERKHPNFIQLSISPPPLPPHALQDDWHFVFGGDTCDKGPGSLRCLQALVSLKRRYPDRVHLLILSGVGLEFLPTSQKQLS